MSYVSEQQAPARLSSGPCVSAPPCNTYLTYCQCRSSIFRYQNKANDGHTLVAQKSCAAAKNYTAVMTGANMVPPVNNTVANGTVLLEWKGSKDNTLDYVITVYNLVRLSILETLGPAPTVKIHTAQLACACILFSR